MRKFSATTVRFSRFCRLGGGPAAAKPDAIRHPETRAKPQARNHNAGERRRSAYSRYCALRASPCGCISAVKKGRLIAVEPDPSHPTGKTLYGKGRAALELMHHEERLLYSAASAVGVDPLTRQV